MLVQEKEICYNEPMKKQSFFADNILIFLIFVIGAAEAANLLGVFFHRAVSQCTAVFGVAVMLLAAAWCMLLALRRRRDLSRAEGGRKEKSALSPAGKGILTVFVLLLLSQLLFMLIGRNVYTEGDMTLETVNSFLQTDAVYQVDPLTGRPYEAGLPSRIEVLCLPMLYAALSRIFHVEPERLVLYAVPVITLLGCYGAYLCLAKSLFPKNREKRLLFLTAVALLIWIGSYSYGVDGFNLLFSGWRGVTIRNGILIPYTLALCLQREYVCALLCALAEVCVVWTLYGLGACAAVIVGTALLQALIRRRTAGKERADGGTS